MQEITSIKGSEGRRVVLCQEGASYCGTVVELDDSGQFFRVHWDTEAEANEEFYFPWNVNGDFWYWDDEPTEEEFYTMIFPT